MDGGDRIAATLARHGGILVRRNQEIRPALERARAEAQAGRPVLINVWVARTAFRKGAI